LLRMIHGQLNNDRTMDFVRQHEEKVTKLNKDMVNDAVKKLINLDRLVIVTAGDFEGVDQNTELPKKAKENEKKK